jgi:DNA-binding NarL/FixJ family response regulator
MKKLRVMLLEDETFTRQTIKTALEQNDIQVVFDTDQVALAIEYASENPLDVAVCDYNLGKGPNGIDAANALRRLQEDLGIVLLTAFLNPRQLESKMSKLPRGSKYLIKHSVTDIGVLVREIEAVAGRSGR